MINNSVNGLVNYQIESSEKLQSNITKLKIEIAAIKNEKNDIKSSLRAAKGMIKQLDRISTKHGDNSIVRLKASGKFKHEKSSSTLKNLFNLDAERLKNERDAATKVVRTKEKTATVKECSEYFSKIVNDEPKKSGELSNRLSYLEGVLLTVTNKLELANAQERKMDEAKNNRKQGIEAFNLLYHTDSGCLAINSAARSKYGHSSSDSNNNLDAKSVLDTYTSIDCDIFNNEMYKDLRYKIMTACQNLNELVKNSATFLYNPSGETRKTYRGQSMTQNGLDRLKKNFDRDKTFIYGPGQFFSTSKEEQIARTFADKNLNDNATVPVIYTITGFSSGSMCLPAGLGYVKNESERMYSPLAMFKVVNISTSKDKDGKEYTDIELREVKRTTSSKVEILPA